MIVKDIFSLYGEDSDKFKILAGEGGISRPVVAVDILEVPDGTFWSTKNEVIVTTAYCIKKNDLTMDTLVEVLVNRGVSALGIKLGRYIESIPDRVLDFANANSFTIFTIPLTYSYASIIQPINSMLIKDNEYDYLLVKRFRNDLLQIPKAEYNIYSIVSSTSRCINKKIYVLTVNSLSELENSLKLSDDKAKACIHSNISNIYNSEYGFKIVSGDKAFMVYKIGGVSTTIAFMCVDVTSENLTTTDFEIIEEATKTLAIYLLSKPEKRASMYKSIEEFYFSVILGDYVGKEDRILEDADKFDIDIKSNKYIWIFDWNGNENYKSGDISRKLFEIIKESKFAYFHKKINDKLVFLVETKKIKTSVKEDADCFENILDKMNKAFGGCDFQIGISNLCKNLEYISCAYDEAIFTLVMERKIGSGSSIFFYEDYIVYHLLSETAGHPALLRLYRNITERLIKYDDAQNAELLKTVEMLIECDFNVAQASEKLFVHRNTLYKRIDKINELLNISIDTAESRMILQIAVKLNKIKKSQ